MLGENNNYQPASLSQCVSYASQYSGIPLSKFYVDSNPQAHEILFSALFPYPDSQGYLYFPWEAVLNGQGMEYVFSNAVSPGDAESTIAPLLP